MSLLFMSIVMLSCAVVLFMGLVVYFLPVIVAYIRKHKNMSAITIMTIFLGWTFLGWLASLLWALNCDTEED